MTGKNFKSHWEDDPAVKDSSSELKPYGFAHKCLVNYWALLKSRKTNSFHALAGSVNPGLGNSSAAVCDTWASGLYLSSLPHDLCNQCQKGVREGSFPIRRCIHVLLYTGMSKRRTVTFPPPSPQQRNYPCSSLCSCISHKLWWRTVLREFYTWRAQQGWKCLLIPWGTTATALQRERSGGRGENPVTSHRNL